eukprot:TRINITY_DN121644_c0_g1_i1.p1 TRINITY_DN121644_c0_g1~~TRINITY_DN121644_c0_g1_i1.p1  ORF type:complete len:116 (+),score=25.17 TRINITY_DN121644_c0_g1_i1:85-432(+)
MDSVGQGYKKTSKISRLGYIVGLVQGLFEMQNSIKQQGSKKSNKHQNNEQQLCTNMCQQKSTTIRATNQSVWQQLVSCKFEQEIQQRGLECTKQNLPEHWIVSFKQDFLAGNGSK